MEECSMKESKKTYVQMRKRSVPIRRLKQQEQKPLFLLNLQLKKGDEFYATLPVYSVVFA
jgi:hypothetical protein